MIRLIVIFIFSSFIPQIVIAQDTLHLSLHNVVEMALLNSPDVKKAQNKNLEKYWDYRRFKTSQMPKLTLSGNIPNYNKNISQVQQPDGSYKFIPTEEANMNSKLSVSQEVAYSGTQIWASTDANLLKNFRDNITEYSGKPFEIGFWQPIFRFNWAHWNQKTKPLEYEESQKQFVQRLEEISYHATQYYFWFLKVSTNYQLAKNNLSNSQANLEIARAKQKLGRISENDFSRIELSVLTARKALNTASMELKNADFDLKSYIGLEQTTYIDLDIPLNTYLFNINAQKALQEATANRKETPAFERKLIEAERDLVKAKRSTGFNASLYGNYGLSKNAPHFDGLYQQPEVSQAVGINFSIPIIDGGRAKSEIKMAEARYDLALYDVDKNREDFQREVLVQVEQFKLLKEQIETSEKADVVANNGYQIAQRKFQNGEISITDLNISLQERENARRDYISTLEAYWLAYYKLRILTLYNFETNQKIIYNNPFIESD